MSSTKRPRPSSPSEPTTTPALSLSQSQIEEGETLHAISTSKTTITDRQSHFSAVYSPSAPVAELRAHPSIAAASHRIAAWRRPAPKRQKRQTVLPGAPPPPSSSSTALEMGWDDDGEARAGRRVLAALEATGAQGAVVVGRWWGGVMLGPVRFTHIENAARAAVEASRGASGGGGGVKKVKITDTSELERDEKERKRLVDVLPTRDEHITILRALLTEKKQLLDSRITADQNEAAAGAAPTSSATSASASASASASSPPKKMQYGTMEIAVLKRLENARDATIAFILKEIEKVEAKLDATAAGTGVASAENSKGKEGGVSSETTSPKPATVASAEHRAAEPGS